MCKHSLVELRQSLHVKRPAGCITVGSYATRANHSFKQETVIATFKELVVITKSSSLIRL